MSNNYKPIDKKRSKVFKEYKDVDGNYHLKIGNKDFQILPIGQNDKIWKLPGFKEDEEIEELLENASYNYNLGYYEEALQKFTLIQHKLPIIKPYIEYHMRVCKHILSIPLNKEEIEYKKERNNYYSVAKLFQWLKKKRRTKVRCKWCGRYIDYVSPDVLIDWFMAISNCCSHCGRLYPIPDWEWDSPDGRAYLYQQGYDEAFNKEFENDYLNK